VKNLPPEQREALKQKLRARAERMTPKERQRLRRDFGVGQRPGGQADR